MTRLTTKTKSLLLEEIKKQRQALQMLKRDNTLHCLEHFENQLTLDELEQCFTAPDLESLNEKLILFLSQRWDRIRHTEMSYTQQPHNGVNQLCLNIARAIAPPASTEDEIDELEPNTGPYCLMMPSLEQSTDIYGQNIHGLALHEFVLSDDGRVYIPVVQCLHQASVSEEGMLRHVVAIDGRYPELTPSEIQRVSQHSELARELYSAVMAFNQKRLIGDDIGSRLSQLAKALRGGGVHSGSGQEFNAGAEANLGILAFSAYWDGLSEPQRIRIFDETPGLKEVIGRLFRPDDANYQETRFCVELLADAIDPIVEVYRKKPTIQALQNDVSKKEARLQSQMERPVGPALIQTGRAPRHILPRIFKLRRDEQEAIFKEYRCTDALWYALAQEPDALKEFDLDEVEKGRAISIRVNERQDSAFIVAAKKGNRDAMALLLSWGAQIESQDLNRSTALHWAANNGHVGAVEWLLDHGALLEAKGHERNTALNFAVMDGRDDVVELLLRKGANVNTRNSGDWSALDIAISRNPRFVFPLLKQLAFLPLDQQAECLKSVPNGPYNTVLFYVVENDPDLLDGLVQHIVHCSNDQGVKEAILKAKDKQGRPTLILAAQMGSEASLRQLLSFGLQIDTTDSKQNTALHWAVSNGHVRAVQCLLEKGADLDRRNNRGENALDIAIRHSPDCLSPILMHLASLPLDKQEESLLNVPGGPYPNVLFYAADKAPELFDDLVKQVVRGSEASSIQSVLEATNTAGWNAFLLAAQRGSTESLQYLRSLGLGIETCDLNHSTALHWASNNGHVKAVEWLLQNGARLEAKGAENNSALHFAVMHGKGDVVQCLLNANADLNARNSADKNALDLAIARHPEWIELLLTQISKLPPEKQSDCLSRVSGGVYQNVWGYVALEQPQMLDRLISQHLTHWTAEDTARFETMHIHQHLQQVAHHYQIMKKKSVHDSSYEAATVAAGTLLKTCGDALATLFQADGSSSTVDQKITPFQTSCKTAIQAAKPVLEKHRGWGKVLAAFLLAILTLPVSLPLYALGVFSGKTKSNQLLDQMSDAIDQSITQSSSRKR